MFIIWFNFAVNIVITLEYYGNEGDITDGAPCLIYVYTHLLWLPERLQASAHKSTENMNVFYKLWWFKSFNGKYEVYNSLTT
jgi:hypothetical protein